MENKDIKLAIFDIDDTLIKRGKITIEESAKHAIKKLQEKGIEVMIATGRAFYFIHDDIHESVSPNYYVSTNGACVYDKDLNLVFKVAMDLDEVNQIVNYARENNLGIALKEEKNMPVYNDLNVFQTIYMQGSNKLDILEDHTQDNKTITKDVMGLFVMGDEDLILGAKKFTDDTFAHAYHQAYDIYSKDAGKIKGIEHVLEDLGLNWSNVISFGDAANDAEMIEKSAIGVAMGNSIDSLKEIADYVTSDITDDGVFNALTHLKLI
ncbi:MAG: HAD family hydrolase [Erysipelothrix sp.]|nr:HAD family hydrolase [Erysipelothrix sp.]